jgi:hypothetical protein
MRAINPSMSSSLGIAVKSPPICSGVGSVITALDAPARDAKRRS